MQNTDEFLIELVALLENKRTFGGMFGENYHDLRQQEIIERYDLTNMPAVDYTELIDIIKKVYEHARNTN